MSEYKQKKFSIFNNFKNSIRGFIEVSKNEKPMQVELILFVVMSCVIFYLDIKIVFKLVLFTSLFIPLVAELLNSAIERNVDLVTLEYHKLAGEAKDAASAGVLVALIITILIWVTVFIHTGII